MAGVQQARAKLKAPAGEPLTSTEIELFDLEDKRAEVWVRRLRGESVTSLATMFGVTRKTIYEWIDRERKDKIAHREQIDEDIEDMVRTVEDQIVLGARNSRAVVPESMAGPSWGKLVLEGIDRLIVLRGLDKDVITKGGKVGTVQVRISIGSADPGVQIVDAELVDEDEVDPLSAAIDAPGD